jgi:hypothetical protein
MLIKRLQWVDYFCSFIESDLSWRIPLFLQCVIGLLLAAGTTVFPESPRWLIDTDQEVEGMRVVADLHGGDPSDPLAIAEFQEIKDKVMEDVCHFLALVLNKVFDGLPCWVAGIRRS